MLAAEQRRHKKVVFAIIVKIIRKYHKNERGEKGDKIKRKTSTKNVKVISIQREQCEDMQYPPRPHPANVESIALFIAAVLCIEVPSKIPAIVLFAVQYLGLFSLSTIIVRHIPRTH
jgi:hypothetical protein